MKENKVKKSKKNEVKIPKKEQEKPIVEEMGDGWKKNAVHELEVVGYTADGSGVCRLDGRVVFVPHTIVGEVWEVQLIKVNRNFAFGRGVTCRTGAKSRVEKDCQFRGKCGGCQFRHMNYEEELRAKHLHLSDSLTRLGGLDFESGDLSLPPVLGAEETNRYRNKVQFPVSGSDAWVKIGFYRLRSHDVLDVADCLLQSEDAGKAREVVKAWMVENRVNPYDEVSGKGTVRHLFLRSNQAGEILLCLVVTRGKVKNITVLSEQLQKALPSLKGFVLNVNKKETNVVLGSEYHTIYGEDFLYEELSGLSFKLSVPSFFQVNYHQTEVLYEKVREFAGLTGKETVLDLYSGIGTIGLILEKDAKKVLCSEILEQAVLDGQENALRNSVGNVEFFQGDCSSVVEKFISDGVSPDVVVVDPPRKGLAGEVPPLLAKLGAEKIVYVSCDPGTLARDIKLFSGLGYGVKRVQGVDLFPRTKHVECVVLLEKG